MRIAGKTRVKNLRAIILTVLLFAIGTLLPADANANPVTAGCVASSGSWVNSALPQAQTGTFRVTFDATPASSGVDGVTGLSLGPANAYTSLAAIVRFNASGTIDAMNGTAYTAAAPIAYLSGTTYHFILDVNIAAHTYNAYVVVGGVQLVIGSQLAFRSPQAGVSSLNNIGSMATLGSQTICNVVVSAVPIMPVVTTQSVNQSVTAGQTASFTVATTGTAPLSYQWSKNGVAISGATSPSYVTPATVVADNGALFTVAVTNSAGSVTSSGATLTVTAPAVAPSITIQPAGQTVVLGQPANLSVAATGTAPLSYQWSKNGAAIGGATSPAYVTPATVITDNGSLFTVVVSNSAGSATSTTATLMVTSPGCIASSGSWVNSALPQAQTGTFRVTFDATPASSGVDGVTGLSLGPASAYTSLAAIVRFNASGTIDAMNGTAYTAAAPIAYLSGTTYHFILDVNIAAHTYNAYVVVGGVQLAIGSQLAFRSPQAGVSSLNNIGSMATLGSQTICNVAVSAVPTMPVVTTQPLSQTITAGQTASFTVAATGTAPVSYQWMKSGAAIGGATSSSYVTPATVVADSGAIFTVVVSNSAGSVTSNSATLTVNPLVIAPLVTTQSVNQSVTAGQTASFTVATTGTAPLSYQWSKNGVAISGATSPSYVTPATVVADNGALFTVAVTNSAGSVTSSGATLTVTAPAVAPSITIQPAGQTVVLGQPANLSVAATGTAPLSYQWSKNGAAIGGATSPAYVTPATVMTDNGALFTVVVSNSAGSATSTTATLMVTSPGCIASSGSWVNSALPQAQTGTFRVTFDATPASSGVDGVTGLSLGPASAYTSLAAIVRFNASGTIDAMNGTAYTAAAPIAYLSGTTYHFILDVNIAAHTYNAYVVVGGVQLAIGSQLAFRSPQAGVSSLNNIGSMAALGSQTICNVAVSAVPTMPVVTTQPLSQTITAGQTASFTVAATGTAPVSYQWMKSGAAIGGATSSSYVTPATVVADSGAIFTVVVSNSAGSVTSNSATLTVNPLVIAPLVTTQSVNQSVTAGQTASFTVATTGTAPLSYQWSKNGVAISGATSPSYMTPATVVADNGALFTVAVTNSAGSVTSSGATLTVKASTLILTASPAQLSFGSVNVNASSIQGATLTNAGNSNVTISNVTISGAGFSPSGGTAGLILTPGQTAPITVTFAPLTAGNVTGSVTVTSNSSPATIALSGTGVGQASHSVYLTWQATASAVVGYNVYSSRVSGGPYVKLTASPTPATNYTDATVQSAQTYYYVATSVGSNNSESGFSAEVSATIP